MSSSALERQEPSFDPTFGGAVEYYQSSLEGDGTVSAVVRDKAKLSELAPGVKFPEGTKILHWENAADQIARRPPAEITLIGGERSLIHQGLDGKILGTSYRDDNGAPSGKFVVLCGPDGEPIAKVRTVFVKTEKELLPSNKNWLQRYMDRPSILVAYISEDNVKCEYDPPEVEPKLPIGQRVAARYLRNVGTDPGTGPYS